MTRGRPGDRARATGAALVPLLLVVAAARARGADGGQAAALRGDVSPKEAVVRVLSARVTLRFTPQREQGIAVGVRSYDEVGCEIAVQNTLERAVRDVQIELTVRREAENGSVRARPRPSPDDEEAAAEGALPATNPIPGWKVKLALDEIPATSSRTAMCRQALAPLEQQDRPASLAELSFAAEVTGYRAPSLPLERALAVLQLGTPADQRAVWNGYGEAVRGDARAFDEAVLLGLLGASPSRQERRTTAELKTGPGAPRTALGFVFLLQAARRIGGQPTLEGLLMHEGRLLSVAPPLPARRDEAHPPPNADLLPDDLRSTLHETVVEVAHHNLAGLYLLLHAPPPPPPPTLLAAARQLALDEGLEEPDAWLEAAAALPADAPQLDPVTGREGTLPIVATLGRYGGPEVVGALARALVADQPSLREQAALALAQRGEAGIGLLVDALDTEDQGRAAPIAAALASIAGADRDLLRGLARRRGVAVAGDAAPDVVVHALLAAQSAGRARLVEERLAEAEALAMSDGLDPRIDQLVAEGRVRAPRACGSPAVRERLGRIAARVYRARVAAGRADARKPLDEAARQGPIADAEFQGALRDADIADARALAPKDIDRALRLLGEAGKGGDERRMREVARELVTAQLDAALADRNRRQAVLLLDRARSVGVPEDELAPRQKRLTRLRLALPLGVAAAALAVALGLSIALLLVRHGRRRSPPLP